MEKVHFEQFVVDRCTECKGLWFGMLEAEHLASLKKADSIDVGSLHPRSATKR